MGKAQRDKGANFERQIAKELNAAGITARRGQVFNHEPDIVTDSNFHFECKRQEVTKIHEWIKQAEDASDDKIPVVIHKRSREDTLATLKWSDFLKLIVYKK